MPKKRKRKRAEEDAPLPAPKPAPIATAFGSLLERAGLNRLPSQARGASGTPAQSTQARAAQRGPTQDGGGIRDQRRADVERDSPPPEPELSQRELSLLHRAYQGVQPIDRPKRGRVERSARQVKAGAAPDASEEVAARERLAALVGGGVRFDVQWEDGFVTGLCAGASPKLLARVRGGGFAPEAQLDLHGLRSAELPRAVVEFVRKQHRLGRSYLLIITGKGQHSEGGVGVLGEALAEALSQGGAAPLVLAFASAHPRHGGQGAVAVMLK